MKRILVLLVIGLGAVSGTTLAGQQAPAPATSPQTAKPAGPAPVTGGEPMSNARTGFQVDRFFGDPRVRYLHLHNARPGCYNCRVDRA